MLIRWRVDVKQSLKWHLQRLQQGNRELSHYLYLRAKELGYTEKQLQQVYKEARDENSRSEQRTEPIPEPKPPESTPEPRKEEMQPMQRMQVQNLSERVRERDYSKSGLTPSGTSSKHKYDGPSILDLADSKRVEI